MSDTGTTTRKLNWKGIALWVVILLAVGWIAKGCLTTEAATPCPTVQKSYASTWDAFMDGVRNGSGCD